MTKIIKLKDLTPEEYTIWCNENCQGQCETKQGCPFVCVNCKDDAFACWVRHKDLFTDKFLNQEVEMEEPEEETFSEEIEMNLKLWLKDLKERRYID